jgi:hypothetical protein
MASGDGDDHITIIHPDDLHLRGYGPKSAVIDKCGVQVLKMVNEQGELVSPSLTLTSSCLTSE